jgi:hypothetical protein
MNTRRANGRQQTCRKHRYPWRSAFIQKSPFKTLKAAKRAYKSAHRGFTATSSLKSMGVLPRSNGCFTLGDKYRQGRINYSGNAL